jgi:hypothetical protein
MLLDLVARGVPGAERAAGGQPDQVLPQAPLRHHALSSQGTPASQLSFFFQCWGSLAFWCVPLTKRSGPNFGSDSFLQCL